MLSLVLCCLLSFLALCQELQIHNLTDVWVFFLAEYAGGHQVAWAAGAWG